MDIQSLIQSGLLEAYVLNQCSAGERAEVERLAALHPEVRAEIEAIERALEQVARANAVPPPDGLKTRIMQRIETEANAAPPATGATGGGRAFRLLPALGWAAALVLGVALVWQNVRLNRADTRIAELQTKITDCETQVRDQEKTQTLIALLRDRDTRTIILSDATTPDAIEHITATVWHNPKRGETALDINSLPRPNPGRYFQFWAIVDGAPRSMGMVTLNGPDSWQPLPFIENAQAFAISEEDKPGGNATPTVVVMVGKAI